MLVRRVGGELLALDPTRERGQGGERDIVVVRRQRTRVVARRREAVLGRRHKPDRGGGVPDHPRSQRVGQPDLPWPRPPLVHRRHRFRPRGNEHRSIGLGIAHARELLRFDECRRRKLGTSCRRGAERDRSTGSGLRRGPAAGRRGRCRRSRRRRPACSGRGCETEWRGNQELSPRVHAGIMTLERPQASAGLGTMTVRGRDAPGSA